MSIRFDSDSLPPPTHTICVKSKPFFHWDLSKSNFRWFNVKENDLQPDWMFNINHQYCDIHECFWHLNAERVVCSGSLLVFTQDDIIATSWMFTMVGMRVKCHQPLASSSSSYKDKTTCVYVLYLSNEMQQMRMNDWIVLPTDLIHGIKVKCNVESAVIQCLQLMFWYWSEWLHATFLKWKNSVHVVFLPSKRGNCCKCECVQFLWKTMKNVHFVWRQTANTQ